MQLPESLFASLSPWPTDPLTHKPIRSPEQHTADEILECTVDQLLGAFPELLLLLNIAHVAYFTVHGNIWMILYTDHPHYVQIIRDSYWLWPLACWQCAEVLNHVLVSSAAQTGQRIESRRCASGERLHLGAPVDLFLFLYNTARSLY